MGCDIHAYAEIFQNGTWQIVKDTNNTPRTFINYISYDVFAILANVRNGRGFAGFAAGDGFSPIALPAGIPTDASVEYKIICEEYGLDGHSHSFLTVSEILNYDWLQVTTKFGVMDKENWLHWSVYNKRRGHSPATYCADISGPNILVMNAEDLDRNNIPEKVTHIKDSWNIPYYRAAAMLWQEDIPQLLALGDPKFVRLVFFFDN